MNTRFLRTLLAEQVLRTWPALVVSYAIGLLVVISARSEVWWNLGIWEDNEIPFLVQVFGLAAATLGLLYTTSSSDALTSGVPPSTRLLPVPSWTIAGARFGWNLFAIAILSAALYATTYQLLDIDLQPAWKIIAIATTVFAALQLVAFAGAPFGDASLAILAATCIALLWSAVKLTATLPERQLAFVCFSTITLSGLASWGIVSAQRRGLWFSGDLPLVSIFARRRADITRKPFASPQAAQRWFETRRIGGIVLPIILAAAAFWSLLLIANLVRGEDWLLLGVRRDAHFESYVEVLMIPFIMTTSILSGASIAFLNFRMQLGTMRAFFYLRPLSSAELASSRLTTLIRLLLLPVAAVSALFIVPALIFTYSAYREAISDPGVTLPNALAAVGASSLHAWLNVLEFTSAVLATTWLLFWVPLDGIAVVLFVLVGTLIDFAFVQGWLRQTETVWVPLSLVLVITIAMLHRYTIRRGLLNTRLLRRVTLAAVTFGLVLLLLETAHIWMVNAEPLPESQKPVPLLRLFLDLVPGYVATLAFCLLPFSTVPLTLHWARHR